MVLQSLHALIEKSCVQIECSELGIFKRRGKDANYVYYSPRDKKRQDSRN